MAPLRRRLAPAALLLAGLATAAPLLNAGRRGGGSALATDFRYSGCIKISSLHEEIEYTGSRLVTVNDCFAFCMKKPGKQYFGVSKGKRCWCAALHEGPRVEDSKCDYPCQ